MTQMIDRLGCCGMKFEEYERGGWSDYAAFGDAVAAILRSAIQSAGGTFRLQQVRARAKDAASLRKKLEKRGKEKNLDLLASEIIEAEIKDLAGCRIIFYTNTDVSQLIRSGLIETNFEVVETKLHHPRRDTEEAAEFYVSNHYVVKLGQDRTALPEYAPFSGMRCEIQVQTILSHAWAEMAHDTIYKQPDLHTFGSKALETIKTRMRKIARKYLLPAGYEFAKVAADFERLIQGEELFKGHALDAIVNAHNNNERANALDTFFDNVLPLYDDLTAEFPDILAALLEAASRARTAPSEPVETPYGELPAKTPVDIMDQIAKVIQKYWYVSPAAAFDTLLTLYADSLSDEERKPLVEAAGQIATQNIYIWRRWGPAIQVMLTNKIRDLNETQKRSALPLLTEVIMKALGTECSGANSTSGAITLLKGAVVPSERLAEMRREAVIQLKVFYLLTGDNAERSAIRAAFWAGTRPPTVGDYEPDLAKLLMETVAELIEFVTSLVRDLSWEELQREEKKVLHQTRVNRALSGEQLAIPGVIELRDRINAAVIAFRTAVDADEEYSIYKVLVGFGVVYPPAWQADQFGHEEEQTYRERAIDSFVDSITPTNADMWQHRIIRCASTESVDLATFLMFDRFLTLAGERRPKIVLGWLEQLTEPLARFLPPMLLGLQKSANMADADLCARQWVASGQWLGEIAWFSRNADPFDETLLVATTEKAVAIDDRNAVGTAMRVAGARFAQHPGSLIERVFMYGLAHMRAAGETSWVGRGWHSWHHKEIIAALNQTEAAQVLDALVSYPDVDGGVNFIVTAIAGQWPECVMKFFCARTVLAASDAYPDEFDAIPFSVGESLREKLSRHPATVLEEVRSWYERDPELFAYHGGHFVAALFPGVGDALGSRLREFLQGSREDIGFVLAILNAFAGASSIDSFVVAAVARLEPDDDLLEVAAQALEQSDGVSGEFGFVQLCENRLARVRALLADENERVRAFAERLVNYFNNRILLETQRAEASAAARRLEYGEDVDEAG